MTKLIIYPTRVFTKKHGWLWQYPWGRMFHKDLDEEFAKGRKRGWCQCRFCACGMSFNDKDIIKRHISGKGCFNPKARLKFLKKQEKERKIGREKIRKVKLMRGKL